MSHYHTGGHPNYLAVTAVQKLQGRKQEQYTWCKAKTEQYTWCRAETEQYTWCRAETKMTRSKMMKDEFYASYLKKNSTPLKK